VRKQMVNIREKGKISHSEWPTILARYAKGETIAQIGRDYGCTAPAIRYIIKRSGKLKHGTVAERATATGASPRPQANADTAAARERGGRWTGTASTRVVPSGHHVLGQELRQRVSGDVASFLVALDHAFLEGSPESVANLQEATDQLMRSTARTRLELERLLSSGDRRGAREKGDWKAGAGQRGA
jgi:hypothetical protein